MRNAVDKGLVQDTLQFKLLVITQSELGSNPARSIGGGKVYANFHPGFFKVYETNLLSP